MKNMTQNDFAVLSIREGCKKHHVSYDTILGLENEFNKERGAEIICISEEVCHKNIQAFSEKGFGSNIDESALGKVDGKKYVFFATMCETDLLIHLEMLKKIHDKLIIYIFDSWETSWENQEKVLKDISPLMVCFAYEKAKEHFKEILDCKVIALPQSMNAEFFHPFSGSKSRIFIQIGRKSEIVHKWAKDYLEAKNIPVNDKSYLYQKSWAEYRRALIKHPISYGIRLLKYRRSAMLTVPDTNDLAKEIAKSRFFLQAPQNIDNENKTGGISEVTARFYEAMACKSLIVGIKPRDSFDRLFPYENAMIEVTEADFADKIDYFINNPEEYDRIVEKNYEYVMANHRWKNRYDIMILQLSTQ